MLKVEVTHLKAPWPAGAAIGSVVLLAAALLPAWAAGKCIVLPREDEREPVGTWEPPAAPSAPELVVNPASAADQLAEHAARIADLGQELQDAQQALGTARAEIASLGAQLIEANAAIEQARSFCAAAEEGHATAARERDAAMAELQALREAMPVTVGTITGDGTGEALPLVEEGKAAKATKKGAAA